MQSIMTDTHNHSTAITTTKDDIERRQGRKTSPCEVNIRMKKDTTSSPEVICNLIASLSLISDPVQHHFRDLPKDLDTSHTPSTGLQTSSTSCYQQESFGRDYGGFSTRLDSERNANASRAIKRVALAPTIATSRPPSGRSRHTALSPPASSPIKRLSIRRTFSDRKVNDKPLDTQSSVPVAIDHRAIENNKVQRQPSVESWKKKQARKDKDILHAKSMDSLKGSDRSRDGTISAVRSFESRTYSYRTEPSINEEVLADSIESSTVRITDNNADDESWTQPIIQDSPEMMSIGGGMYIPVRKSSLRKKTSRSVKNSPHRTHHSNNHSPRPNHLSEVSEEQERDDSSKQASTAEYRLSKSLEQSAKMHEPLEIPPLTGYDDVRPSTAEMLQDWRIYNQHDKSLPRRPGTRHSDGIVYDSDSGATRLGRRVMSDSIAGPTISTAPTSVPGGTNIWRNSNTSTKSAPPLEPVSHSSARPTSSDSVDDSVNAFLCSPRLSQKIRDPRTGRTISFSEVGDSEGYAVFVCVGMGLTRYITAFYDELALTLKLRLITPDRPGVGESEPCPENTSTPLSWPDDVYTICQALKITKFSVLAHSAGATYALATALRMPQHIRGKIHLLAPWIPPSQLNVTNEQQVAPPANPIPTSQRILRALPAPFLRVANSSFMNVTSASVTTSLPRGSKKNGQRKSGVGLSKDNQQTQASNENRPASPTPSRSSPSPSKARIDSMLLSNQDSATTARQLNYDTRLTHAIWNLATQNANPAIDLLVCLERYQPIGFRYVDVTRQIVIHHGTKDSRVPVENVKWLGGLMRNCEVRILEGEGHGLMASAGVMGGVLVEIGREWEVWEGAVGRAQGGVDHRRRMDVGEDFI